MKQYHFSAEMAKLYGIEEAIFLENLAFWVEVNTANRQNIHDGRVWTYNSQSAFTEIFDLWTRRQIQRILRNLENQGAIIKGNYNKKAMDRTMWYTVSDEVLDHYGIPRLSALEDQTAEDGQMVLPIEPCGAMDSTVRCHPLTGTVPAIPDNKPDIKPDNTLSGKEPERAREAFFDAFWEAYPRHDHKKETRKVWEKLNPDETLFHQIMIGLDAQMRSPQWRDERNCFRKQFIPLATTWLNGERWKDEGFRSTGPEAPRRLDPGEGYEYV